MPLPKLLKRASSFILGSQTENSAAPFADGEIVFCKNNVCVHPPTLMRQNCDIVHHPGYLTVSCRYKCTQSKPTLCLSWIPNTTLRKNPWTIEKRQSQIASGDEAYDTLSLPSLHGHVSRDETAKESSGEEANSVPGYFRQSSAESIESRCSSCSNAMLGSVETPPSSLNGADCEKLTRRESLPPHNSCTAMHHNSNPSISNIAHISRNKLNQCRTKESLHSPDFSKQTEEVNLISCLAAQNVFQEQLSTNPNSEPPKDNLNLSLIPSCTRNANIQENNSDKIIVDRSLDSKLFQDDNSNYDCVQIERQDNLICAMNRLETKGPLVTAHDSVAPGDSTRVEEAVVALCLNHEDNRVSEQVSRSPSLTSTNSLGVPLTAPATGDEVPTWMSSPELLALQHNLTFPESLTASPVIRKTHRCRRFSVDLSEMRSLRLFFNDVACTCGQLVVASRESQYKILHFHHGGLDRLAKVLQEWHFLLHSPQPNTDQSLPYRHFMVCRPEVGQDELHPEEGKVPAVGVDVWQDLLNEDGQLEDDLALRKGIFFGGLEPSMRKIVWPFLLQCFTFQSTHEDRQQIQEIRRQEYYEITRRKLDMDPEEGQKFWRNVQCIIEKDVIRTDRANPYFAGEDNPNIEIMKNILLNYAVYNPGFGYTQGMSDLLAPVLAEIQNEADAFWCFVGLMQKAIFVCTPTDNDMDKNLCYLRELIRLMVPHFHSHLERHADAMELLFCHRWILLCFKREFPETEALRMWESCWANYLTDYFHLFLCLAIVCIYSDDVIAQDLRTDEMLLHFSSLAMFMDGELILRKARGLLHQFRQMPRIPCTLGSLCQLCGPGMWDSTHAPVIECIGQHSSHEPCPHRGMQQC